MIIIVDKTKATIVGAKVGTATVIEVLLPSSTCRTF